MKSHSRKSVTVPHTSRPLTELPPKHIHGITDNDVPAIELATVNLGNAQNLGIGEMTTELDQKPDKGSSLLQDCITTVNSSKYDITDKRMIIEANKRSEPFLMWINGEQDV